MLYLNNSRANKSSIGASLGRSQELLMQPQTKKNMNKIQIILRIYCDLSSKFSSSSFQLSLLQFVSIAMNEMRKNVRGMLMDNFSLAIQTAREKEFFYNICSKQREA